MVDGAGYIIQGDEGEIGIDLSNRHNVTMGNMDVSGFVYGIYLNGASFNSVSENNISNNGYGITLAYSSNYNSITQNNMGARAH